MGIFYSMANSVGNGMNNVKKILLTMTVLMVFNGCSSSIPSCSDSETTDLVLQIAKQELQKYLKVVTITSHTPEFTGINKIMTTNTDEKTGFHECKAELEKSFNGSEMKLPIPITYKVEKTDKGEIYVTVYGL
jgi:hypothetical protein